MITSPVMKITGACLKVSYVTISQLGLFYKQADVAVKHKIIGTLRSKLCSKNWIVVMMNSLLKIFSHSNIIAIEFVRMKNVYQVAHK